ncbi:response regulator transcription factor [Hymenobacter sp. BT664]|uniref:Response regulator transcription factor n=1 Tax=Hymenobacter montanus TaxID=2771359 RepID=A0A927BHA2_9BACT|nr:response regulator transcription factor [Hymenobacter montanus]MBD2769888.1 response regulator transcription factor [Hymenobacter montanus]
MTTAPLLPRTRALLIEDEYLARQELHYLLREAHPEVDIVGEAADADTARRLIAELRPDLLLLDISLPGETGFELLESLDEVPLVVFITAYDQYATRAFQVSALDYVLKPVHPERLAQALARVRLALGAAAPARAETTSIPYPGARLTPQSQVFLKDGEQCYFVRLADIDLFEAVGNYVRVYFGAHAPLHHRSLQQLEEKLPPDLFFRVNRQQILNLTTIEKVHAYYKGGLLLEVRGGRRVDVSTRQAVRFKELLSL